MAQQPRVQAVKLSISLIPCYWDCRTQSSTPFKWQVRTVLPNKLTSREFLFMGKKSRLKREKRENPSFRITIGTAIHEGDAGGDIALQTKHQAALSNKRAISAQGARNRSGNGSGQIWLCLKRPFLGRGEFSMHRGLCAPCGKVPRHMSSSSSSREATRFARRFDFGGGQSAATIWRNPGGWAR